MPFASLHHEAVKHIVRRGLEAGANHGLAIAAGEANNNPLNCAPEDVLCPRDFEISHAGIAVLVSTVVLFGLTIIALRYTLWGVVNTLAMVETPLNGYILDTPPKTVDQNGQPIDVEVTPVSQKPITSSIRATIRHLHQTAGFRARWRGLFAFICYSIVFDITSGVAASILAFLPVFLSGILSAIVAALVMCLWSTAWTHVVISEPSAKPWYRRIPGSKAFKNVWQPVVVNSVAERLTYLLPMLTASVAIPTAGRPLENEANVYGLSKLFGCFFLGLALYVMVALPSKVTLIRVQASMLPEEDESIVNFDRSFNNKVVPAIVGGSGALSFMDAWKSFDREARLRVVKNVVKLCAIEIALHLALFITLVGEVFIFAKRVQKDQPSSF